MDAQGYGSLFETAREGKAALPEQVVQCVWFDQLFSTEGLTTDQGLPLRIVSPGWWNHGEGPDFKGAQIQFGETVRTGDVEIHLDHAGWRQHGHDSDPRYDNVVLEVVLSSKPPVSPPFTSAGRRIACLLLGKYVMSDLLQLSESLAVEDYPYRVDMSRGHCAQLPQEAVRRFALQAGDWRLLHKAKTVRERMERAGPDQAVYEVFLSACGYSRFKHHFRLIARHLPYERAVQLARQDPFLLETALLQIAGLLPESLPGDAGDAVHFKRLATLRKTYLDGLRSLPIAWPRTGVRPTNYPERRLAGAARFLSKASRTGLCALLDEVWREEMSPMERRKQFEGLFPSPMGFWAEHCTWTGKSLGTPIAPLGSGRARSIIGNVFLPAALAAARMRRDIQMEDRVHALYAALPKEAPNHIIEIMLPRAFGERVPKRITFREQQGLLQLYQDWCEPNPSCRNCPAIPHLTNSLAVAMNPD